MVVFDTQRGWVERRVCCVPDEEEEFELGGDGLLLIIHEGRLNSRRKEEGICVVKVGSQAKADLVVRGWYSEKEAEEGVTVRNDVVWVLPGFRQGGQKEDLLWSFLFSFSINSKVHTRARRMKA